MDLARFKESQSGRLVRALQGQLSYWAFVPNPLPPILPLDVELWQVLSRADRALGELAGLGRQIANPQLLIRPFINREAVLSSRIEGTRASIADLYAYEAGQVPLPGMKSAMIALDVQEVANYVSALEYGLERVNTFPVSKRLIRELHERLMRGVRGEVAYPGEFRRVQNWIGPPGCMLNEARFIPPPTPDMEDALSDLEKYLHTENSYPPLVRLALIHYQFEAIHPFVDGNGRIGRLLISLLLVHWNLLPMPLLYLSAFFEQHRQEYYDLLLAVSERGAWHEWVSFFLRGVAEQSADAIHRAKQLQDLREDWRQRLTEAHASSLILRLADSLFSSPVITSRQVEHLLAVTHRTANRNIGKLIEAGILRQLGNASYGRVYIAQDILRIVSQENQKD
jgi:Fic family protein